MMKLLNSWELNLHKQQLNYFHQYLLTELESATETTPGNSVQLRDFGKLYRRQQVEAALQRLNKGTYGKCMACGTEIVYYRLNADPAILSCAKCE